MRNKIIFLTFIFSLINAHASNNDYEDEGWEIVEHSTQNYQNEEREDLDIKFKAVTNTALTLMGGVALKLIDTGIYFAEKGIETRMNQFQAGFTQASRSAGNLYGNGVAIRTMYNNEKRLLNSNNRK